MIVSTTILLETRFTMNKVELIEQLRMVDEITLLELLEISTEDLIDAGEQLL